MRRIGLYGMLACVAPLIMSVGSAFAAGDGGAASEGKALLGEHCARCHSIVATGDSPLEKAPPLREVYLTFPIQQLEGGFAEGMGSRHQDMPQIQFSTEQVSAILDYLGDITGVPPSRLPRSDLPEGEDIPP